jgi:type II secretory pathway pseudopilin PulG
VELLVVIVVMLIVMTAVFALMRGSITTANANYEMTGAAQGLRNSQEFITRDVLVAGDGFKGVSSIWLPTTFVARYLTARTSAVLDPTNKGFISIGTILADDNLPAGTNVLGTNPATTVGSIKPTTDRLTLLAVDPNFSSIDIPIGAINLNLGRINIPSTRIGDFKVGEIYYITSGGKGTFGTITAVNSGANTIFWADGDALGLNKTGTTGLLAAASSIVCDAFFPLSKTWFDASSALYPKGISGGDVYRKAAENLSSTSESTTVRAGIIAGQNISAITGCPAETRIMTELTAEFIITRAFWRYGVMTV